jgi:hypothetical protein
VALKVVYSIIYKVTVKERLPYKELISMAEEEPKLLFYIRNLAESQAKHHIIEIHEAINEPQFLCVVLDVAYIFKLLVLPSRPVEVFELLRAFERRGNS